jgi:hypothetical protein
LLNNVPADPPKDSPSLLNEPPKDAPKGAPDTYSAFTAPEGWELDAKAIEEVTPLFKESGLSQEQAQKYIDFYSKLSAEAAETPARLVREQNDAWVAEIKADPEIGGKLDQVRTTVSRAIDSVLGPELGPQFRQAMDFTGAGNNPAFVKAMYRFASLLSEGGHVKGGGPSALGQDGKGRPASAASALYPNLP